MIAHALKLSLGLFFGINTILNLGWGNSRTHLSEKERKMKKCIWPWIYTNKKLDRIKKEKNQEQKKWSLKKKVCLCQNKKTNSSNVLPILLE